MTFNPWSENIWIKKRFFDKYENIDDPMCLCLTTNYLCNEFLNATDYMLFEELKESNPRRYSIEGMGEWGISEGLVYSNFRKAEPHEEDVFKILKKTDQYGRPLYNDLYGLDWGYTHPTAFIALLASEQQRKIYVFDEFYQTGMTNDEISDKIYEMGYSQEIIKADGANAQNIAELRNRGITRIRDARKGRVVEGIQKLQDYEIIVFSHCENTWKELNNYAWEIDKDGITTDKPCKDYDHLMDALRYACDNISGNTFTF